MKRFPIFFFLVLAISSHAQDSLSAAAKEKYLGLNQAALDMADNDDFSTFAMLDSVLPRYQVYFTGEQHYTEGDFEVKWKVLKYFYQKAGVRVLVIEHPPSYGFLLDKYMENKDSLGYNSMVDYAPEGTKERVFYRSLYEFNKVKPREEQVRIVGLDIDYVKAYSQRAFEVMLKEREAAKKDASVRVREELQQVTDKKISADSLLKKIEADSVFYQNFFEKDYGTIQRILRSIACNCEPPSERKMGDPRWAKRESYMFDNFISYLKEFPTLRLYGQFGAKHISLEPNIRWYNGDNWTSVASQLNTMDSSPVKGKVCSVLLSYSYEWNSPKEERKMFYHASSKHRFAMFKLNNSGSPFVKLARSVQFMVNLNYSSDDEIEYNNDNDIYGIMDDEQYTLVGPLIGYQYWERQVLSAGIEVRARYLKERKYFGGLGLHFEMNLKSERMHGYRTNLWFGGNFVGGLNLVYNTNYKNSAFFFRPEAGFARNTFSITYAYNVKIYNKYLTEGLNAHMVAAKLFLPFWKD